MSDTEDDIRKRVQERVEQELASMPPPEEAPKITSQLIRDCLFHNAQGDGILYSTLYRNQFLFCKNSREWYEWQGHCWQRDIMDRSLAAVEKVAELYSSELQVIAGEMADLNREDGDENSKKIGKLIGLQKSLLKRASQLRDDKRRTACLKFAHTIDSPLAVTGDQFDKKPMLFPCANGVIDLETGELLAGRPSDYLSKSSPIEFLGIDSPAPLWEKTLLEIFGGNDDLVAYLQRLFGYGATGLFAEKVFPVLFGRTGWNGRSLIMETISHVMGDFAGAIPSEMLLSARYAKNSSSPSPDIMGLKGIRMAFASEIDEGMKFSAAKIKWLTGKDELTGRSPHDKHLTHFKPTHKLFLMTNTQPQAPPNDKAFWDRMHLIPFLISFVNRDPQESHERRAILDLDRQVLKESPGILAWLVRGCLLWQRHGLNPPREVTEATEQYRRNEDLLADWSDERCFREPGAKDKGSVLYASFVDWYHENVGKNEPSGTWFGKQLSSKFEKRKSDGHIVYYGIALKNE